MAVSDYLDATEDNFSTMGSFDEFAKNLEYARELVRGGRQLERLRVGAFDVADLYRAAWVQAISALDHWVHREFYDRALAFALDTSTPRPARFLRIEVPMSLFEDVRLRRATLEDAFRTHLRARFGYVSFVNPTRIKEAFGYVSDAPLWSAVASELSNPEGSTSVTAQAVQARLSAITARRNQIAHATDRRPDGNGARNPLSDSETTEAIDWVERIAAAILTAIGPPPTNRAFDASANQAGPLRSRWTRQDLDDAATCIENDRIRDTVRGLFSHADRHAATFRGGIGGEPSCGMYYLVGDVRRSPWSLYSTPERPRLALNLGSVRHWLPAGKDAARLMIAELRRAPALDAALLLPTHRTARRFPVCEVSSTAGSSLGGALSFGNAAETSCFPLLRGPIHRKDAIWPLAIYPTTGAVEVVFQHLARRAPFDDPFLRRELLDRINSIDGIDLPESKLALRPSFPLTVLRTPDAANQLGAVLAWFATTCSSEPA